MVEVTLTIVLEVVKCLAPLAVDEINYLRDRKYTRNLQNLKTEVENLKSERMSTQHQVDEAKREGKEIEEKVENWLASANNAIVEADKFTDDEATTDKRCFKGLCPNLRTRRRLCKEAVRRKEAIVKVREARKFDRVSYRTAPVDIRLISCKDYEAFESRMPTFRNIISAVEDPDVNMLGIYGMGGIGKTMLEVARKVKSDKLFDQVVFVEVSKSQDIRKIQGEIADKLGLKFHEESEPGRANSLFKRIKEEKKIFIILDNIWENLDLRATGIPHGDDHKGCKILLTGRSEDTLSRKMDSRPNFSIGCLNEEEAWCLFKKLTGDYIEGSEFKWIATGVAKECAGLPVSIVTVARALRNNKSLFDWKDALEQLRRPSLKNFMNIQPNAYKAIKLSYDNLGTEELKNIFLLIGYTAIASIDDLLMYGMGLGLFQGVNKIEVARARVHALVRKLKASCMLLDHISKNEEFFSMHDVVRDVAISIACREQNVFSVTEEQVDGCRKWSDESAVQLYTSIVLRDIKTNLLPEVVKCPQLRLFFLRAEKESSSLTIPNKFFERMKRVGVINLTYMNVQSLPPSLGLLLNLRTLSLCYCKLLDVSIIGNLEELEVLCLRGCDIRQLPVELGQLTWLKLLDLRDCSKLEVIPPNILSNLSHLEELNIGDNSFDKWEVEVDGVKNASLDELKHLTSLELQIKDVNSLPRGLFFEKLERYRILIGDFWNWKYNIRSRDFRIELNSKICLKDGLIVQLQGIEHLGLYGLREQDVQNFVNELVKVGSSQLKHLWIEGCHDALNPAESMRSEESTNDVWSNVILDDNINISNTLEKVALPKLETLELYSINIERIWRNQVVAMSCGIQNLTCLKMYNCRNLRYLFSSSMVSNNSFVRLQHLELRECPALEELIVMDDQEESKNSNTVMFPQLEYLNMNGLGELKSFCTEDLHIEFPSLKQLKIANCPELMVKYKSTAHDLIEKSQDDSISDARLNEIILEDKVNIPKTLLFEKVVLPNLEILKLYDLNVERIWKSHHTTMSSGVQNLTHLTIYDCRNLRCLLLTSYIVGSFVQLQHLEIIKCPGLEEIVIADDQEESNYKILMFPQLQYLGMKDLEKLTCFCSGDFHVEFPSLKELRILRCPKFMVKYRSTTHELIEKVFPNLEELIVDAKHVATNNSLFLEDFLYKLKCLDVAFDDESTTILSLDDFLRRFHTMKVLRIEGGLNFSLSEERAENGMEVIIRDVNKCCDLKHFVKEESSTMDNLEWLTISSCDHLINLVPSSHSFQNLTTLVVSYCKGLKNVLTSSTARTLVRLREMRISECNVMTKIVADDDDAANDEIIIFSELKKLKLWDLKSLTSFCSGNCAFKFPYLEMLLVDNCPNMKNFSGGELSTPKLYNVHLSSWNEELWIWEHDLNTTIQQLYLKKQHEFLQSQQFSPSASARNLNLQTKLYSLHAMVAGVWSDDSSLQLEATTQFKELLSAERSPQIEKVIQSGVVPRFVEFLIREDYPQLQYEAAWALTNIASGTSENTNVVIDYGAVPIFVKLLASPNDDVREQAVWALGNVAGDSPRCRDLVLREKALIPLLAQLNEHAKLSMLRRATWTLSNFCRGKPQPPFDQVMLALPVLAQLVHSNDEELLTNACRALSDLSNGTNEKIQAVIEAHVCPRLVELLGHPSPSVLTLALRTVGNITAGDDFQTQYIINCGALPSLLGLLMQNYKKSIKKDACWTISNITAGNREQIQAVIDAGLIGPLVNLLQDAEFDIKEEAAWAISNSTSSGTYEQIKYLVREECVESLCDLFLCPDPRIVTVCLKGLENILKVGEAEKNMDATIRDINQHAQLDNLQSDYNNDISEKAIEILKAYSVHGMRFRDEEEDTQGQGDN